MCGAGPAETCRAAGADEACVRAGRAVAAGREVCQRGDERPAEAERLEHRPARRGPYPRPDAAAAEPCCLGHLCRDGRGGAAVTGAAVTDAAVTGAAAVVTVEAVDAADAPWETPVVPVQVSTCLGALPWACR